MEEKNLCGFFKNKPGEREGKIVMEGMINFSFGKNGLGLTDELLQVGELVKTLSKDNYVYIEDSFIDACDDVYDLKFHVTPHEGNKWMLKRKELSYSECNEDRAGYMYGESMQHKKETPEIMENNSCGCRKD